MASSRVGTSTSANGAVVPRAPTRLMRSRIGRANAAVLPVPVAAWPSRSRPSMSGGMDSRWIGVGSSYPRAVTAASTPSGNPRSAKVTAPGPP